MQCAFYKCVTLCCTYPVQFIIFNLKYKTGQCKHLVIEDIYYTIWIERVSFYVSRSFSFSTFIKCPMLILHWHIVNIVLGFLKVFYISHKTEDVGLILIQGICNMRDRISLRNWPYLPGQQICLSLTLVFGNGQGTRSKACCLTPCLSYHGGNGLAPL